MDLEISGKSLTFKLKVILMFRIYFLIHRDLKDRTRSELTQITGCKQPCFYREFSQVGNKEVIKTFDKHGTIEV